MKTLKATTTPMKDIALVSYDGQDERLKQYRRGYEDYFNEMIIIENDDLMERVKVDYNRGTMQILSDKLRANASWLIEDGPGPGEFFRTIIGMESPTVGLLPPRIKEGAEIVVAQWGDGFTSPVHGHATGYMHEEIIFGKVRVNTYKKLPGDTNIVRPLRTDIVTRGTFVSEFAKHDPTSNNKRQTLIHSFTSIGYTASLHYLPEHTRDGRDNGFIVQHFTTNFDFAHQSNFTQLTAQQGITDLKPGDVALVRSSNVAEYGDHYIVVTGAPVMKEHGLRPQEIAIHAVGTDAILAMFQPIQGVTLLKFSDSLAAGFRLFHSIRIQHGQVIFPKP